MRKVYFILKHYVTGFFRIILSFLEGGYECVVCGKGCYIIPICKDCRKVYLNYELPESSCSCCGKELISTKNLCSSCREEKIINHIDKMTPLYSYRMWNKELMFTWKMKGIRSLSFFFAVILDKFLKVNNIDFIVPVPPRKGKIRKNGWDQIDELCKYLKNFYNYKTLEILERKSSVQQKKLDRSERLKSIESAYSIVDNKTYYKALRKYDGKLPSKVCLIDDVFTTGATLECCAKLLKQTGINKVYGICLFIVD